jgi:hypothetical protein
MQDKNAFIANAAIGREAEMSIYQVNIDNYTAMLLALPQDTWPDDIVQYQNATIESLPHDMPDDEVFKISDYQYRDRITKLLRTEKVEQVKVQHVYNALLSQLPPDGADVIPTVTDLLTSARNAYYAVAPTPA